MKRSIYFRLFIVVLVAAMSVMLFSYVRARNTKAEEPCNESGKCGSGSKAEQNSCDCSQDIQSEFPIHCVSPELGRAL